MDIQLKTANDNLELFSQMIKSLEQDVLEINKNTDERVKEINKNLHKLTYNKKQLADIESKLEKLKTDAKELNYQLGLYQTMKKNNKFSFFKLRPFFK